MSLAGENQPADVSDWDGSDDDDDESPLSAYDSDISDQPNEPREEIPRDEIGPPYDQQIVPCISLMKSLCNSYVIIQMPRHVLSLVLI